MGVRVRVEGVYTLAHWEGKADTVGKEAGEVLLAVVEYVEHREAPGDTEGQDEPKAEVVRS